MPERPERLPCGDEPPARHVRRRVDELLSAGELVAFPTETVYGIAARADDVAAVAALRALKGLAPDRALTWHVATRAAVDEFEPLAPLARRLAARYWPGPLTLVLAGVPSGLEAAASGGWTGVRLPAHRGTLGILERLSYPVVMSSANATGQPPLGSAGEVATAFGERLALVLDGGRPRLGEASCVLALGPGRFEVLREGLLVLDDLQRTAGLAIGFACTGNTCRSPMAEGLARRWLGRRLGVEDGGPWTVSARSAHAIEDFGFYLGSMGVATSPGYPASEGALLVMREQGLDISRHCSRLASLGEVQGYDLVYCMTQGHLDALRRLLPPGQHGKLALLDPAGGDVPDPVGAPLPVYRECAARIERLIAARVADWA